MEKQCKFSLNYYVYLFKVPFTITRCKRGVTSVRRFSPDDHKLILSLILQHPHIGFFNITWPRNLTILNTDKK